MASLLAERSQKRSHHQSLRSPLKCESISRTLGFEKETIYKDDSDIKAWNSESGSRDGKYIKINWNYFFQAVHFHR